MSNPSYCSCGAKEPTSLTKQAKSAWSNYRAGATRYPFRVRYWLVCAWCGHGRESVRCDTLYCKRACKEAARHAADRAERRSRKGPRKCARCDAELPSSMRADATYCSERCMTLSARQRRGRKHDPRSSRRQNLKRLYGLTEEQYDMMVLTQGATCAICDTPHIDLPRKRLCVDHDHMTGEVRGLLCVSCNAALGKLRDDAALLRAAADYLERHSAA